jgi:fluoroacetyl-CoA thioesterase
MGNHIMKHTLKMGLSRVDRFVVDQGRTIAFMGEAGRVYSTPSLVLDVEHTCRNLLLEHLDAGEDSVGIEIALQHTAPTLMGMTVEISASVTVVDGRKVSFEINARDELERIGGGTHTRFVVDIGKTYDRLQAKASKRAAT